MSNLEVRFWQAFQRIWMGRRSLLNFGVSKLIVPFLIVLNLCITLPLAAFINIWIDEAYSLNTTGKDIEYAINQSLHFELQPPLYFALLTIWRSFNHSIFFARLFSIICISLTIYIVAILSQKIIKTIHPGWVATLVSLNPFIISYAVEIRLYAFLILLCALLLLTFFDGYLTEINQKKPRYFYILFALFAIYTQYYLGFMLVAHGFVLLILRRWAQLRHYLFDMSIVGICFVPMLLVIPTQISAYTKTVVASSFLEGLRIISQRLISYNLEKPWVPLPEGQKVIGYLIALIIVIIVLHQNRRFITLNNQTIWLITITLSILFVILINIHGKLLVDSRHSSILLIPSILSVLSVWSVIEEKYRSKIVIIWIFIVLLVNITSLYVNYKPMAKEGDYARIATYIMAHEKPDQAILVFDAEAALPLAYYYSGLNTLVPIPKAEDFKTYDLQDFVLNDEKEIFTALSNVPGTHQYIWLITNNACNPLNVDLHCPILEEFVHKYYSVEINKAFFGSGVRLLHRN